LCLGHAGPLAGQWTHRYPKLAGLSHHVYLEGYELPTLTAGPFEPAPSPDGTRIAFASRGWIWLFDPATKEATRLTAGAGIDSRPAWSPDGQRVAFVRDNTKITTIVIRELKSGAERVVVEDQAIALDPAFTADGGTLYYSSSVAGDLDIWKLDLASGTKTRITEGKGLELKPMPHPDGKRLVYLSKPAVGGNGVAVRELASGQERMLASGAILSMLRPALSPDGRVVAMNWPTSNASGWDLRLIGVDQPGPTVILTEARGLPLAPAWTPDGRQVLFAEANDRQAMELFRVPAGGGATSGIAVAGWNWGAPTGRLRIVTRRADQSSRLTPARLAVADGAGHPLVPEEGQSRFDGQNGVTFFYGNGTIELEAPAGPIDVMAVLGIATPPAKQRVTIRPGETETVTLDLQPVWDARAHGWLAGEHHFHLNYGGPYRLAPDDLVPMANGEDMDVLTPLLANLHLRFEDQPNFAWHHVRERPFIAWGQEVRAHFFGHVGLINTPDLFWPWIWGPGYEVYGQDDRPNRDPLEHARREGGVNFYVHPIMKPEPFTPENQGGIPVGFVPDLVQGFIDGLEVACLWSDELGTMDLWYRALNFGMPLAPTAGTDVMNNFYRTMAVGTTRVYVRTDSALGIRGYYDGLKAGRSFVTNGPLLDFHVGTATPGDVLPDRPKRVTWTLDVHSAVPVERIEVVVNGSVVTTSAGLTAAGSKTTTGTIDLPVGGWIAARAIGGATTAWPAMDSYAFAHTAPIWIGRKGSTTPATRQRAAADLLAALDVAERSMQKAYGGAPGPRLVEHYRAARAILAPIAGGESVSGHEE
jgi:TolB protein